MGQYHIVVNLNKKQFVHPGGLGLGAKQAEHFWGERNIGQAIYLLTCVPVGRGGGDIVDGNYKFIGSWLGDRIAVVGDYSVDEDLPSYPGFGDVYRECQNRLDLMYDCYGIGKTKDLANPWRDITADLAIEMSECLEIAIIPQDHPTLWSDGCQKPQQMIDNARKVKESLMKENK
jgi:hypothetical protein